MTVLHIREQGAVVRREAELIRVTLRPTQTQQAKVLAQSPVHELEQLVIYGNVQITSQAVALLLEQDVDVVFMSLYGRVRGRMNKNGSRFARLRHAQLRLSGDDGRSLAVAKRIVQAKLANQRTLLIGLATGPGAFAGTTLRKSGEGIEQMRRDSSRAATLDALRGYEGKAGVYYFGTVRALLEPSWSFQGRNYHPATDPFNALLSFGYALLQKDVTATAELVGLDPYLGCFHAMTYDRPSLTLDLMEEFRPVVVDHTVLHMALGGKIKPAEFTFTGVAERPVELGDGLLPVVIRAYEERLQQAVTHGDSESKQLLRRCLELQARIYARVVMGERHEYEGLKLKEGE
jgi:CRISPR-associated protein Cas1